MCMCAHMGTPKYFVRNWRMCLWSLASPDLQCGPAGSRPRRVSGPDWSPKAVCWKIFSCSGRLGFLFYSVSTEIEWDLSIVRRAICLLRVHQFMLISSKYLCSWCIELAITAPMGYAYRCKAPSRTSAITTPWGPYVEPTPTSEFLLNANIF